MVSALNDTDLRQRAWSAAAQVVDPEIPVLTIADLGVLRDVAVSDGRVEVAPLPRKSFVAHAAIGAIGALALGFTMHRWTDAALPWLDAALTAYSLVAQWWQARRHIAAWWLWIVVDVIYVGEYVYKSLLITSALYAGFIVLAVIGLRSWRRAQHPRAAGA